jgi:HEAT repeat protein
MNMEKQSSIEKEWAKALDSLEPEKAIHAIYEIRNSGSIKMLQPLIKMIRNEIPLVIRTEILNLLADIKSQDAVPFIADSLETMEFGDQLPALVAACWQSGLDFSKHLPVFAKLFIHSDYLTSLEAFTVLEESFPNATDVARTECVRYLRHSEDLVIDDKLALFRELLKVIESIY